MDCDEPDEDQDEPTGKREETGRKSIKHRDAFGWKSALRKRCAERVKEARLARANLGRDVDDSADIYRLIREELDAWRRDQEAAAEGHSEDPDALDEVLLEIQHELMQQEAEWIRASLEDAEEVSDSEVFCPACHVFAHAQFDKSGIFCRCGFRIRSKADGIRLQDLRAILDHCVAAHSEYCKAGADIGVLPDFDPSSVIIHCSDCGLFEIVI